jgi:membrane-associated PAP2 superfamily phosphatase
VIWTFVSYFKKRFELFPRVILMIALLVGTMTVSSLKLIFDVDCPWDLLQYGGEKPFMSLFAYKAEFLPSSGCFPAAHASAGFTLISTYFYMRLFNPQYTNIALGLTLFIGFGFGLAQQFRGAHFLSHDITSLIVCILVNHIIFAIAFKNKKLKGKLSTRF